MTSLRKGGSLRLVYNTPLLIHLSLSFFLSLSLSLLSLPCPSPFIYSTSGPFIIIIFSFSLIIPLSSCLSLLEFRFSPFHPLIVPIHAPFLSVVFSFPFVTLPLPPLHGAVLPIYPTGKKKKEENRGARRELYRQGDARRRRCQRRDAA